MAQQAALSSRAWQRMLSGRRLDLLEARVVDSDYEAAFARVAGAKRALVIVFTDLFDRAAAAPRHDRTSPTKGLRRRGGPSSFRKPQRTAIPPCAAFRLR